MLRVAVVSKSDEHGGGASRIATRLAHLLNESNARADHWVGSIPASCREGISTLGGGRFRTFFWRGISFLSRKLGFTDIYTFEWLFPSIKYLKQNYDVVHVHDISRTLSPYTIRSLAESVPVVWTLHDCSTFTAGCLYPIDCDNFTRSCGGCSRLDEWPMHTKYDRTKYIHRLKKKLYNDLPIKFVAPSAWMAEEFARSSIFDRKVTVIPNGVDTDLYKPSIDQSRLRAHLNISIDDFLITISAASLDDPRKGIDSALETLRSFSGSFHAVLIGEPSDTLLAHLKGMRYTTTGYIEDPARLRDWYAAADVMLFTSYADNLPTAILESMACGTPCVAFSTGGVAEIIEHGVSGWLSKSGDIKGATQGLEVAYCDRELLARWSCASRQRVLDQFSEANFLNRHLEMYRQLFE